MTAASRRNPDPRGGIRLALTIAVAAIAAISVLPSVEGASAAGPRTPDALPLRNFGVVTIYANGTVSNPLAPIAVTGNDYRLTANMSGSLVIQRANAQVDGNGYVLTYASGGDGSAVTINYTSGVNLSGLSLAGKPSQEALAVNSANAIGVFGCNLTLSAPAAYTLYATNDVGLTVNDNLLSNGTVGTFWGLNLSQLDMIGNSFDATAGFAVYISHSTGVNLSENSVVGTSGLSFYFDRGYTAYANQILNGTAFGNGFVSFASQDGEGIANTIANVEYPFASTYDTNMYFARNNISASDALGPHWLNSVNIQNDSSVQFVDNEVTNDQQVYLLDDRGITASGDTIRNGWGAGIYIDASQGVVAANDTFSNEVQAMVALAGAGSLYFANESFETPVSSTGLYALDVDGLTVLNTTMAPIASTALEVVGSSNVDLGNLGFRGSGTSMLLSNVTDLSVTGVNANAAGPVVGTMLEGNVTFNDNSFSASAPVSLGMDPLSPATAQIASNQFSNMPTPLTLDALNGGEVVGNSFQGANGSYAVLVNGSAGTTVEDNSIAASAGTVALAFTGDAGLSVESNDVSNAAVGFSLTNSAESTVEANLFANASSAYALAGESLGNAIYHNNFEEDGPGTIGVEAVSNSWNAAYPVAGNYWSNDTSPDALHGPGQNLSGPDGVVDHPLSLGGAVEDRYPLVDPWTTRSLTFVATGLPAGVGWSVLINGTTVRNTGSTASYDDPYGAYFLFGYTVGAPDGYSVTPASGLVWVNTSSVEIRLVFSNALYTVTFTQQGLAAGLKWSVELEGLTMSTTGPSLAFHEPNGSFEYSVLPLANYAAHPSSGTVDVRGSGASVALRFTSTLSYSLTFTANDLPSHGGWNVTVNGTKQFSATDEIQFTLPNGTYPWIVEAPNGYGALPANGSATVRGASQELAITFSMLSYTVTFRALGLALGHLWTVTVIGSNMTFQKSNSSGPIRFDLEPAQTTPPEYSYGFQVDASGYNASPSQQNFVLTSDLNFTITFTATGGSSASPWGFLGNPTLWAGAIGAVVAALAIFLLLARRRRPRLEPPARHTRRGPVREWR